MSSAKKTGKMVLASAAAALLASAPVSTYATTKDNAVGKCWGVNSCKGSSNCKTATSACAGKNSCKAEGFLTMKFVQCQELGGDFEKSNNN